ncbi:hypothetical protein FSARC_8555 [Fusarium sarcochroum]|uniref:Uncharacterized protein n=1 Tax=Fusarium sarcochroum TaxID=1208366 RepID=A0A8H4TT16_9HYPO|nr:hypothetical protein FSARC_8555 [Fusarium sarcochroum]
MSASASNLSSAQYGYDFVVAVTQASVDATLKAFMASLQEPVVSVCYVADDNGDPVQMDFETFKTTAGGTDPFTMPNGADSHGADVKNLINARFLAGFRAQIGMPPVQDPANIPNIVTLSSDISAVQYNMVCSEFTIVQLKFGGFGPTSFTSASQPSDKPWYMQSMVNLNLSAVDNAGYKNLPPTVQDQIKNMSDSAFSVQQLLFDLSSAKLSSPPDIEGVPSGTPTYTLLEEFFTGAYFTEMQKGGQPLLGCSVVPQQAATATMTITDMNLMSNPYVDDTTGQPLVDPSSLQQSLSTLNYLCAADNAQLPQSTHFGWNWLEAADVSDHDGILAINRNCFRDYFKQNLQDYIPAVCFKVDANCNADGLSSDMSVDFTPGGQATPNEVPGETVLSYSYSNNSYDEAGLNGDLGSLDVSTSYNLQTQFTTINGTATVIITQNLVIGCNMKRNFTRTNGNIVDKTIVDTYTLAVNDSGVLGATLVSQPTDNGATPSTDGFEDFFTHSNEVAACIKQQADALVSSNLRDIPLSVLQKYIFPGGQTFTFKDVRFSDNQDLLASITYVDPTAAPLTVPPQAS